jgi:hypothetical protein
MTGSLQTPVLSEFETTLDIRHLPSFQKVLCLISMFVPLNFLGTILRHKCNLIFHFFMMATL